MTRGIENIDAGEKNEMAKWSGRNAHELRVSVKAAAINIVITLQGSCLLV